MASTSSKSKTTIHPTQVEPPLDYTFWITLPIFLSLLCLALPGQLQQWTLIALNKVPLLGHLAPKPKPVANLQSSEQANKTAFQSALVATLNVEGGCQNDARDPGNAGGGYTCKGVTQETYNRFFQGDVRNMTQAQMEKIYYTGYWLESGADKLPMPLAAIMFDVAVNSGSGTADKLLAEIKNSVQGKSPKEQALALLKRREAFYRGLNNSTFQQGWLNRNAHLINLVNNGSLGTTAIAASSMPSATPDVANPQDPPSGFGVAPDAISRAKQATVTIYAGKEIGSGSIVTPSGLVLTNCHVIRGAASITVKLSGGERYSAVTMRSACRDDLALLQIKTTQILPTLLLAATDPTPAKQAVTVIGAPYGKSGTVTTGQLESLRYQDFVVSQEMVAPGNSGGPLLNEKGEMIGVVRAVDKRNGKGIAKRASAARRLISIPAK